MPTNGAVRTAGGPVDFATCRIYYEDATSALTRLQDLHRRALGEDGPFATAVANTFSPEDAFLAYSDTSAAMMAQLAIASPSAHVAMLDALVGVVAKTGSLGGLDAMFLNTARAAQYAGDFGAVARAAELFGDVGLPDIRGGGALTSALFDVGTGLLSFVTSEDLGQALSAGAGGWLGSPALTMGQLGSPLATAGLTGLDLLFSGGMPGLGDGVPAGIGTVGPSPELTGDTAEEGAKLGAAVGSVVGGAAGFFVGLPGGPGTAVGVGAGGSALGSAVGGGVGYLIGWVTERQDTTPLPAGSDRPYGPYGPFIGPYVDGTAGTGTGTTGTGTTGTGTTGTGTGTGTGTTGTGTGTGTTGTGTGTGTGTTGDAGSDKKTIRPGESTKSPVDDGSGGGSLNAGTGAGWLPARCPYGEGMSSFAVAQREALLLIGLPSFDDDGGLGLDGFFPIERVANGGVPAHQALRGRVTSPTTDRTSPGRGTISPQLIVTGPSTRLTIPARVDGVSTHGPADSVRALLETALKFR